MLAPGDVFEGAVYARATGGPGAARFYLDVTCGDRTERVLIDGRVIASVKAVARSAEITRYPGARRAAFAWRGDIDHYDTSTFQSIAGLTVAFELGRRYRFPQTLFMSSRLTVDLAAAEEFYGHFGVDRGQREIPEFIEWLRSQVDFRHMSAYPWKSAKP